jgi:hypothetical protein
MHDTKESPLSKDTQKKLTLDVVKYHVQEGIKRAEGPQFLDDPYKGLNASEKNKRVIDDFIKAIRGWHAKTQEQDNSQASINDLQASIVSRRYAEQTEDLRRMELLPPEGRSVPDTLVYAQYEYNDAREALVQASQRLYDNYSRHIGDKNRNSYVVQQLWNDVSSPIVRGRLESLHKNIHSDLANIRDGKDSLIQDTLIGVDLTLLMGHTTNDNIPLNDKNHIHRFLQDLGL